MKRLGFMLLFGLLFAGTLLAKVQLSPDGEINHFWVEKNQLKLSSPALIEPKTLYAFTQEVSGFDIQVYNTKFYLTFTVKENLRSGGVYLTSQQGKTFSPPLLISSGGKNASIAVSDNLVTIAWEEGGKINYLRLEEGLIPIGSLEHIEITGEALSAPSLAVDNFNNVHLAFLGSNSNTKLKSVFYTHLDHPSPKILFRSYDQLINMQLKNYAFGLLIFWQSAYLERKEGYFTVSLAGGENFGAAKHFDFPTIVGFSQDLLSLDLQNNQLVGVRRDKITGLPAKEEIKLPVLAQPEIISPLDNSATNFSNLKVEYLASTNDPSLYKIEVSREETFPALSTWSFEQLLSPPTLETNAYRLPLELTEGTYFLRLYAFDGISTSYPSETVLFKIDNIAPQISSLETERVERNLITRGRINEFPAYLTLNQSWISLEANGSFTAISSLQAGANLFTWQVSDEAGNFNISSFEVFYNPASPEITVLKPEPLFWARSGGALFLEARVFDLEEDLEEESKISIWIDNQEIENMLNYYPEEESISGFITLPPNLSDGRHIGSIAVQDKLGNVGRSAFLINVDNSPPVYTQAAGEICFTNSPLAFSLPLIDEGAGIDPAGTLIEIAGISFEGTASEEGGRIVVSSNQAQGNNGCLAEGTYEVRVASRDIIGNLGETFSFSLVVDTTPPAITLLGSYEPQTSQTDILLQAGIVETHPAKLEVLNKGKLVESAVLSGAYFSKSIKLVPGENDITLKAFDRAGNSASREVRTFANIQPASNLITQHNSGPNPFSQGSENMYFTYTLASTLDLKIYVFDLTGSLIWSKEIKNASSGNTAWNGVSQFGERIGNGVYPYIISASLAGATEIKRGKIIAYQ